MSASTDDTPPASGAARFDAARLASVLLPVAILVLALAGWEAVVQINEIPPYILPAPSQIAATLVKDWPVLFGSLLVTLRITFLALFAAVVGGVLLAILFAQSRWIELSFFPFAVILQVTPIVAIAPLLLIYLEPGTAVLVCAFLVAFFPILSNTALGLASADHNLRDLFDLYGASRFKQLVYLRLPAALPYFLGGLRIGGGLALIGAIVAEFFGTPVVGMGFRISTEVGRMNVDMVWAEIAVAALAGSVFYGVVALAERAVTFWHPSIRGG